MSDFLNVGFLADSAAPRTGQGQVRVAPAGSPPAAGGGSLLGLQSLRNFAEVSAVGGALLSSVGAYYSAEANRYNLRSRALDADFAATIAGSNARAAELDAEAQLIAGQQQKGLVTLRFGQTKAAVRTRTAAAVLELGVGSAAEVAASIEAAKEIDAMTIEMNAVRAAGASRRRAVDFRNQAALARVSAANLRDSASSINPGLAAATSLISSAGPVSASLLNIFGGR